MLFANAAGYRARICVTVTRVGVIMQLSMESVRLYHSMKPTADRSAARMK